MKLDDIKREIACRPDEAVLTLNNLITVGDLRRLIAENDALSQKLADLEVHGGPVAIVRVGKLEHGPFIFNETPHGADVLKDGEHSLYMRSQHSVSETTRERVISAIAQAIGGDAYDCTRVWSAWSYGTMGPDDFCLIIEDDSRLAEIADAAIAAALAPATKETP